MKKNHIIFLLSVEATWHDYMHGWKIVIIKGILSGFFPTDADILYIALVMMDMVSFHKWLSAKIPLGHGFDSWPML